MQTLCYHGKYVSKKVFKTAMWKNNQEEVRKIRLYSDALSFFRAALLHFVSRFLITTYERLSFQKRFKTGSCDLPKYEFPDICIFEEFIHKFIVFLQTCICHAKADNASFLYQ